MAAWRYEISILVLKNISRVSATPVKYLERFSYDLEKVFAICFKDRCLARLKQNHLLIPAKETPNMGSKQIDCPITLLHFK